VRPELPHDAANGRRVHVSPDYARVTLKNDFVAFCRQKGWPVPGLKLLARTILQWAEERGIPASHSRTHRSRRWVIKGLAIIDESSRWNGNENTL